PYFSESVASRILSSMGVNLILLKNEIATFLDSAASSQKNDKREIPSCPVLSQYGKNLNLLAMENKIDPLFCRDDEVLRLIQILSRRTKNNPCLIGEPGVGKTSIVEGLAKRIVDKDVPSDLLNKTVVCLDLSSMVAGAKYRGEFEERMKSVLNELKNSENLILFIDEIHTIVGAGSAEGALDASNIIKPSLARGHIQVIGATTTKEYRRYIEKDSALERRFQPVLVNEPSKAEAGKILFGLRERYEIHHGVKISDDAIIGAVNLSVRYINDRFLPDKAIDLIDEASSYVKIKNMEYSTRLKELDLKLKELFEKKEKAILDEDFSLASDIRDEEIKCRLEYNKEKSRVEKKSNESAPVVTYEDIAYTVTKWTNIPVSRMTQGEEDMLRNLESRLKERVIGQDDAIKVIANAIKRGRIGLKNPKRPIGAFLFLGPTGVGKTELCRAISEVVFGSENNIIRLDMSEYMEKHSVSRLIGSPPGYVGYEDGGQLSEAVKSKPYSLVLFDEIEKAHSEVYNILLQIMDEGALTDSQGRKIDFKNTILIMTSNIGAKSIIEPKKLGFGDNRDNENEKMKAQINDALKREFNPEFLNRLDEIVIFNKLSKDDIKEISKVMLDEVKSLALGVGIMLNYD
ncbi:MAG: ATP-dependent Clp protease ATP-binding subunit, partial [Clostridia bacterium]|nr:ATP-dependent Clp protease ATP-binding subunit [Clostridia bacterium]